MTSSSRELECIVEDEEREKSHPPHQTACQGGMTDRWSATRRAKEDRRKWRSGIWNVRLDMEIKEK
jgi:hypothetical protein